jgi:polysaccharide biosynthesis protein PslH
VRVVPYRPFRPGAPRAIAGALSRTPRSLIDTYSRQVRQHVADAVRGNLPDVIIASELETVPYALATQGIPLLLEGLEVTTHLEAWLRSPTAGQRLRAGLTWFKLAAYLRRVLPRFAACTVASLPEALNVLRAAPSYEHLEVVPNAVDLGSYQRNFGPFERTALIFSGTLSYAPNQDAVRFLAREVFPAVAERVLAAHLRITGRVPDSMRSYSGPGVQFTGYVPDVRPLVARSAVSVAPIRFGGGTRLKILEALALGTPVVATTKGAEGLEVEHGQNILMADDAASFAECVVRVMQHPDVRARLAEGGRRLVELRYDWTVVGEQLCGLLERIVSQSKQSTLARA